MRPRNPQYLERAVAALRSTFAIAPFENWAHTGGSQGDVQGALSSAAHWGECSASTSVGFTRAQLGDLFIHIGEAPHGVCVNGCTLTGLRVSALSININVTTPFDWSKHATEGFVIIFEDVSTPFNIILNGHESGKFNVTQLQNGVTLPVRNLHAHG